MKRIPVYVKDLQAYIDLIREELEDVGQDLSEIVDTFNQKASIPFPLFDVDTMLDTYHVSTLGLISLSSVQMLKREMENVSVKFIEDCAQEYVMLPSRNTGQPGHFQPNTEEITISDANLPMIDEVADYLEAKEIKVPYLRRGGKTAYKVAIGLAIIFAGRQLKQLRQAGRHSEQN